MKVSKGKAKLNKRIKKAKEIHPKSRKSFKLRGALLRQDRIQKGKKERQELKVRPLVERFLFFKFAMDPEVSCFTIDHLRDLAELWLDRHKEELEKLNKMQVNGCSRPPKPRADVLESTMRQERAEYKNFGLSLPDLTCPETVQFLSRWQGDHNQLPLIKLINVKPPEKSKELSV